VRILLTGASGFIGQKQGDSVARGESAEVEELDDPRLARGNGGSCLLRLIFLDHSRLHHSLVCSLVKNPMVKRKT